MKTVLILFIILLPILFSCDSFIENSSKTREVIGSFFDKSEIDEQHTVKLGESLQDSIDIRYPDTCFDRSYFSTKKKSEFVYEMTLISVLTSGNCIDTMPISKVSFTFTPTQTGIYTLHLIGQNDSVTKTLIVN